MDSSVYAKSHYDLLEETVAEPKQHRENRQSNRRI